MNSYFKWPLSQVPHNTTPTKTPKYQFYSKFNPEKSLHQDQTINDISSNKNEQISNQSINKQPTNQLISKQTVKSMQYQVQIPQLSQLHMVNQSNEVKLIQLQKKLTLTQAQLINAKSQISSLNGIKIDLSQRLQRQQCLKVQYLQRIHKQQNEIFEMRQNDKLLEQRINSLLQQNKRQLRIIQPSFMVQRVDINDNNKLKIKCIIDDFNESIKILQRQRKQYVRQIDELQQKLLKVNTDKLRYEQQRIRIINEKKIMVDKLGQLQKYVEQIQQKNKQLQQKNKQIQQKNRQLNKTIIKIQNNKINKCLIEEDINKDIKVDKIQFNKQLNHYKHNQHILKSQINTLKSQINTLNIRNNQLCKEITKLKIQIGNQQSYPYIQSNIQPNYILSNQQQEKSNLKQPNNIQYLKHKQQSNIKHGLDIKQQSNIQQKQNITQGRRSSVNGLWSPKGVNSSFYGYKSNAYLIRTQQKLNQTIFNNHYQVQKYKQKCYKLQNQLINLRQQYQAKSSSIQLMQQQLNQQNLRFNITIRTIQQKYKFEIQNLKYQIKNLQHNLNQYMQTNQRKNQQIKQKQSLLQRWVSQKNLIK